MNNPREQPTRSRKASLRIAPSVPQLTPLAHVTVTTELRGFEAAQHAVRLALADQTLWPMQEAAVEPALGELRSSSDSGDTSSVGLDSTVPLPPCQRERLHQSQHVGFRFLALG